jgi:hypothetical protein
VAAAPEAAHVEIDERHHNEGEAAGRKSGAPVVDAEFLKDKHGAPVVEGGLLEPGLAVEIGRDAGAEPAFEGVGRIEADEHLVRDLRVPRLVGADQAETVAAEPGRDSIEDEEDGEADEDCGFAKGGPSGPLPARSFRRLGSG